LVIHWWFACKPLYSSPQKSDILATFFTSDVNTLFGDSAGEEFALALLYIAESSFPSLTPH
jgi:hypothetical protein